MLHLKETVLQEQRRQWEEAGIRVYAFDREVVRKKTKETPQWVHFGGGNIFRAFIARIYQELLEQGKAKTGIIVAETYDEEVIEKVYRPFDDLSLAVTMYADGRFMQEVVASVTESYVCNKAFAEDWAELERIFKNPSLQIASFTITEKGYALKDYRGEYFADVADDMRHGPGVVKSTMGRIAALAYQRFLAGAYPLTFLSLDNCSKNGEKLCGALTAFAEQWVANGLAEKEFAAYLSNNEKTSFPWSMIDKITPRSSERVKHLLEEMSFGDTEPIETKKGSYAAFVNAEKAEYLVIEEHFCNGRPPLESCGVLFTDRERVDRVERMKVGTCLNPLHTALAIYGCLLGYTLIADEMKDDRLKKLVERIAYREGLPVVVDPGVLSPQTFVKEVLTERFPNPNLPDTPQRIATDTSQKVGIRFGETIRAYGDKASTLTYIPLVIAGWCRYLLGKDDQWQEFAVSPDPLLEELQKELSGIRLGEPQTAKGKLRKILSDEKIFGSNLYSIGLGEKIEGLFSEMLSERGSVARLLEKYTATTD